MSQRAIAGLSAGPPQFSVSAGDESIVIAATCWLSGMPVSVGRGGKQPRFAGANWHVSLRFATPCPAAFIAATCSGVFPPCAS